MNHIKQIFQLHHQGRSLKFIERKLGVSRNTVRKYLALRRASGRSIPDLLALEDPELARVLLACDAGHPGDDRYKQLHVDYFLRSKWYAGAHPGQAIINISRLFFYKKT